VTQVHERGDGPERGLDRRAARLRRDLVAALDQAGMFPDPALRAAFAEVPRHVFVPAYHDFAGPLLRRDDPDPAVRERWLAGVHADQALVTRTGEGGEPISSSSQPSLMAGMLHDLDLADDSTVLEIGTGTGYNAALLSHRLGDSRVTSIDVSPELTGTARARLARIGHRPRLVTGDGALGWPPAAPYDRVIATCRVDAVPPAWLAQLTPDGVILAPLGAGLVRVERTGERSGRGRFTGPAYFMPLRPAAARPPAPPAGRHGAASRRPTALTAAEATDPAFRFLVSLIEPTLTETEDDEAAGTLGLRAADGSTARMHGDGTVTEAGPRRVWTRLEAAHRVFAEAGRPWMDRFGIDLGGPGGRDQRLWLDDPDGPSWRL
jgi:protein-L-isoaspartate(D-aspartate) O-methyltransferase